jgi:hypothetical protein
VVACLPPLPLDWEPPVSVQGRALRPVRTPGVLAEMEGAEATGRDERWRPGGDGEGRKDA